MENSKKYPHLAKACSARTSKTYSPLATPSSVTASKTHSPLATPSATRAVLQASGLDPKYSFGQNFLVNDAIIGKILDLSKCCKDDFVIEVGPGLGTLTIAILNTGARVLAIEKDKDMSDILQTNVRKYCHEYADNLRVINCDALGFDFSFFAKNSDIKLISNLPYNVAAPIIISYFQKLHSLQSAIVMVQREVAQRIVAVPGSKNYGAYTAKLAFYTNTTGKFNVSCNNFMPKPRVESMVVRLDRKPAADSSAYTVNDKVLQLACIIADAAFANRRKTIANSVKNYCDAQIFMTGSSEHTLSSSASSYDASPVLDSAIILASMKDAGIDTSKRAETLLPEAFIAAAKVAAANIYH